MAFVVKKSTFTLITIIAVSFIAVASIITTVVILNNRGIGPNKNKAAVTGNVALSFLPTSVNAVSGDSFTLSVNIKPTSAIAVQGYDIKINFDNNKLTVTDLNYKLGLANDTLGDTNAKLPSVNEKGAIDLNSEIKAANGRTLNANTENEVVVISFTSKSSSPSIINIDPINMSQVFQIADDGSIAELNGVLEEQTKVNNNNNSTPTPTPTDVLFSDAPSPTPTVTPTDKPQKSITPTPTPTDIFTSDTPIPTTRTTSSTSTPVPTTANPAYTTSVVSTTAITYSNSQQNTATPVPTSKNTVDTSLTSTITLKTANPIIKGNNSTANYFSLDNLSSRYSVTPDTDGNWSYTMSDSLSNGSHNVKVYTSDGTVLSATDFIISVPLPNTGVLDELILPTLISIGLLVSCGILFIKSKKRIIR